MAPNLLTFGGLAALFTAGLQNIRNFFSYISSFVIVTAEIHGPPARLMKYYLRDHYKIVPSGILLYGIEYLSIKSKGSQGYVPFQLIPNSVIFYSGFRILVVHSGDDTCKISTLRGFDFRKLIEGIIREKDDEINSSVTSNFSIRKKIGSEKGNYQKEGPRRKRGDSATDDLPQTISTGNSYSLPNILKDFSFMYPREDYIFSREDNPFKALNFNAEILAHIERAKQWKDSSKWYAERSIPWRRGWLLHGPGGTGKSSLAKGVAQHLGIPIYMYYLSTMSDQEFMNEWDIMERPCIALFEDFDSVFVLREAQTEHKSLTFDTVLNQISGVASTDGIFLIVTTNHIEKIDAALGVSVEGGSLSTRPGRIDTVIYLGFADLETKISIANRILKDWPHESNLTIDKYSATDLTPAQFTEICIQEAYRLMEMDERKTNVIQINTKAKVTNAITN